jgi:myo-inositol-1(or 4)-monophosphatase
MFAEQIFLKHLGSYGTIESEESGIMGSGDATIIIDPIDGSNNALSGLPYYGTSVAKINADGILDAAMVCNLASGDIFVMDEDSRPMEGKLFEDGLSEICSISDSEIGIFERSYLHPEVIAGLKEEGLKFRSLGATALSLAYAHRVSFVLYVGSARIYDIVAGLALCRDLEVIVEDEYVIVSQSKQIAKQIENIVRRSYV